MNKQPITKLSTILLIFVLLTSLWFRFPRIGADLPYFYNEDEAHHFNRVVNMVKSGDWNPHYFHKPSLHFYLRMPVVAASFLWTVREGNIKKIEEIRTRDSFGIADYAFTASHPGIVKWNRAFSVLLSLGCVFLTFLILQQLAISQFGSILGALIAGMSPSFIEHSAVIGVDVVMSFFCLLASYFALLTYKNFSIKSIWILGIICGLAISSKYNALPIAILPLMVCLLSKKYSFVTIIISLISVDLGFILGSPYVLVEFPLFLNQLAYEIWHYGVAGHVGHTAEPGIAQAVFYSKWLIKDAVGITIFLTSIVGWFYLFKTKKGVLVLLFPTLFILLMVFQKANFTRNMIVILPYLGIFSIMACEKFLSLKLLQSRLLQYKWLVLVILLAQPFFTSLHERNLLSATPESRNELTSWLKDNIKENISIAIAGELWLSPEAFNGAGIQQVSEKKESPFSLLQKGYSYLVTGSNYLFEKPAYLTELQSIAGTSEIQRIVKNPEIKIYELNQKNFFTWKTLAVTPDLPTINLNKDSVINECAVQDENRCWLTTTYTKFTLPTDLKTLKLKAISPWKEQELAVITPTDIKKFKINQNEEVNLEVPLTSKELNEPIFIHLAKVLSPASQKVNEDRRRLGASLLVE